MIHALYRLYLHLHHLTLHDIRLGLRMKLTDSFIREMTLRSMYGQFVTDNAFATLDRYL